jgi:type IX secretion system PorP/SprF family membrane protein
MKKMIKYTFLLSLCMLLFSNNKLNAQQEQMYSHYDYNSFALNPAYAGSKRTLVANSLVRKQWVDFPGAPTYYNLGVHAPLIGDFAGGINIQTGTIGKFAVASPISETQIAASIAYNKKITKDLRLAVGLRGGLYNYNFSLSKLQNVGNDNAFKNNDYNFNAPMIGFGAYLYSEKFFVGLSAPRMVFVPQNAVNNINIEYAAKTQYNFSAGVVLDVNDDVKLKPTTQVKVGSGIPVQVDINLHAIYKDNYSIGAFYRTEGDIGIMATAAVSPSFTLVYSYDSKLKPLNTYIQGSHEFGLQYMIPYVANNRVRVPRYF